MDNLKDDLNDVVSRVRKFALSVLDGHPIRVMLRTYLTSGERVSQFW
jgi:hypothetical protein